MKNRLFLFKLLFISLLFSAQYFAGQKTFNVVSGNWSTAGNWLPSGVPANTDTVTIRPGTTCTVNVAAVCAALILNPGAASTLSINNARSLTVSGPFIVKNSATLGGPGPATINGKLIVDTTGNLTKSAGNLTIGDTVRVYGSINFSSTTGTKIFSRVILIEVSGKWTNTANESFTLRGGITNYGSFSSGTGTYTISNNNQSFNGNSLTISGSITISTNITLTNNTLLTVTGTLNGNGGTSTFVNASNAYLYLNGTTVMTTGNLTASASGNTVNYSRAGAQTLEATTYYNLILSGSGIKTTTGVTVSGKLSLQGTATVSALPTYGAAAVLEYKGSAAQTTGVEFPATMNNAVLIDNINGVTLNSARTLDDSLILRNGYLMTTAANLLTIGANGTAVTGSAASFVNGPLARIKNTAAQQTLYFPVGKNSAYRPLELVITHTNTTASTYTAELFNTAPAARTLPASLSSVSTVRYWNLTKSGSAVVSSAFVVLHYEADDGVSDPENLRVAKDNGTTWTDLGGTANGSPSGSILSGAFTTFSDFVLANASGGSNPLPVELSSFKAVPAGKEVMLTWTTQTEVDNYGFEIEKCSENRSWQKIAFVEGHGNSNSPKEYSYSEKILSPGRYFYRLKQIDGNGNYNYSTKLEVIVSEQPNSFELGQNYPNPFNPETKIKFSVAEDVYTLIKVYDIIGNEVSVLFNENAKAGKIYEVIFNGRECASGIYFYSISAGKFSAVRKMMLIK